MNRLRQQAAVRQAKSHAERRAELLMLIPPSIHISHFELDMWRGGPPENVVRLSKKAHARGFLVTPVSDGRDGRGGQTVYFDPPIR